MIAMKLDRLSNLLGKVWHFRHLSPSDLHRIVNAGDVQRFSQGSIIFQESAPSAGMFVLFTGKVHLCKLSHAGQEQIIAIINPVIMFNELTAIDGRANPFTAVAVEDCLTWNISHEAFVDLVKRYPDPEIGLGMLRVLAARTRLLINRCEDLSFRPVIARTAKLLLELSSNAERKIDRSEIPVKEMAARLATVPEAISRSLSSLHEDRMIDSTRTEIHVLDPAGLAEVAQIELSAIFE
jgi:CRP-like cAMP-binding protein